MVKWFGRWGSSAVRAYVEDARADAPQVLRFAEQVGGSWNQHDIGHKKDTSCKGSDATSTQPQPAIQDMQEPEKPVMPFLNPDAAEQITKFVEGLVRAREAAQHGEQVVFVTRRATKKIHIAEGYIISLGPDLWARVEVRVASTPRRESQHAPFRERWRDLCQVQAYGDTPASSAGQRH